jgi:PAS domain S-box-containing protein
LARGPDEVLKELFESERRFSLAFAYERDAISVFDVAAQRFIDVNEAWVELYGYSREEALSMTPADVSDEQEATRASIEERAAGKAISRVDLRWHRKKDGTRFPVELSCGQVELGGRAAVYAVMRDITERVQADEALRRSEASSRALIEGIPYGVFVHRFGKIVYINPAGLDLVGYREHPDEILGMEALDFVHPDERAVVQQRIAQYMKQGKTAPVLEERFRRRDGSYFMVEVTGIPVMFDGEPAALALVRDISVKKRMEAQLIVSDRLASLGRLAASVGHEINNPLAYVLGNVQMLEQDLSRLGSSGRVDAETLEQLLDRLSAVEQGAERVRDIVRDLKTLAPSNDEPRGAVDLHGVLDVCADMAEHEIRHRARLVKDYGEAAMVEASEGRLGQIFLNLLVNAAQAIPEGNVLDNDVRLATRRLGADHVLVEISDSGSGIPEEVLGRIFEPFFSTKAPGAGTGLGLSICHHLVTSVGGSIEVRRRAPRGTTFRVTLPLSRSAVVQSREPVEASRPVVGRRVLVIDDEERFAAMLVSFLGGYDVSVAHSGRQAIERFEQGEQFDVVLCDLMMGDMTGMDVYDYLTRSGSGAEHRMILMTGGAFTPRAQEFLDAVDNPRLDKPFRVSEVARAIHELLSQAAE